MDAPDRAVPSISNGSVTVEVRDLYVTYRVFEDSAFRARDLLARRFRPRRYSDVHAIRGIDFEAHSGEAIGVVGSNGSGKSTLLRVIAGLQPKASGSVRTAGEAHLLGVNAVLKPQLSGLRNVVIGGLAMGMSRSDIDERFSEVLEFADIGDAIRRPMQTYSSGMRARLAFSIAMLRVPDVLLIDEALAVGDKQFRDRSLARINEMRHDASTVLLVTHNLREIEATCERTIWIDDGCVVADGPSDEILAAYDSGP